ncbi:MAG TPA: hypothetical protein VKS81_03965, partial [Bacteroidota bacterium]|nr:hypothetical protein [Bacteroidota bacterium]
HELLRFKGQSKYLRAECFAAYAKYRESMDLFEAAEMEFRERQNFAGGNDSSESKLHRIQLKRAELYLELDQPQKALAAAQAVLFNEGNPPGDEIKGEACYILARVSARSPGPFPKSALAYLEEGVAQVPVDSISEIGWKLHFELANEYRKLKDFEKASSHYKQAKVGINYFVWRFTSESLRSVYLAALNRSAVLKEIARYL